MPKVPPEYKARLKRRIVEGASRVFNREGFAESSMDDIAGEVGVSKGTLYLYFPSKVALLREIQATGRQRYLQQMAELAAGKDLVRPMVRMFEREIEGVTHPAIYYSLLTEATRDPELREALNDDHRADEADLKRFLARLESAGRIRAGHDLDALATIVIGLLEGAAGRYLIGDDRAHTRRSLDRALREALGVPGTPAQRRRRTGRVERTSTRLSRRQPARSR